MAEPAEPDPDSDDNNGYVQVFVKPLEQNTFKMASKLFGFNHQGTIDRWIFYIQMAVIAMFILIFLTCDLTHLFDRFCLIAMPLCCIVIGYCSLALYLRKMWTSTSMYCLFCSCFVGEMLGQILFRTWESTHPLMYTIILIAVSISGVFSQLLFTHQLYISLLVIFTRYLACGTLRDLPLILRPMTAHVCGIFGVFAAKYIETLMKPTKSAFSPNEMRIPIIKRRRSSASSTHSTHSTIAPHFPSRASRRTSLPALIHQKSQSPCGYEMAVIGEVHGLISDMLADTGLPPHIVTGLRAIGTLLKPAQDNHVSLHRPKLNPLVSLNETLSNGSDNEDLPYTGERPSSLPKRLRRSLPPSLLRRMSTSTWTTTTSATGMPTLEPEPCRQRSASVRLNRDSTTPGSSPCQTPSPSSPTRVMLTIPKSRSFSSCQASSTSLAPPKPRKPSPLTSSPETADAGFDDVVRVKDVVSDDVKREQDILRAMREVNLKRLTVTSDYESSDSPSDHSDNLAGNEEAAPTTARGRRQGKDETSCDQIKVCDNCTKMRRESAPVPVDKHHVDDTVETVFDLEKLERNPLLSISRLKEWDYPIFDLAESSGKYILSSVAYRLFTDAGLMDTFRIPVQEFFNYFHALELGYREKPYHNREHATDVLHGVYFLTTQPIPGFMYVNPEADNFSRERRKSNSLTVEDCENDRNNHRKSLASTESEYGVMGANFPALELMSLYTAAAMHDFDHPGRTNAFLVATNAPQAVLYNDRSVLENHHAAAAWRLLLAHPRYNFLKHLDKAEFKRFRYLVIESILATDLKRHFEIVAEFNAKMNDDDAPGIDWTSEADRILVSQIVIKLADINGPAKKSDLHLAWTDRITEEFYEQGDEEASLGMPISPYMDRKNPQLVKLQQSFIHHLVALLVNACSAAGILPGQWVGEPESSSSSEGEQSDTEPDNDEENSDATSPTSSRRPKKARQIVCQLTKNLKDNIDMWTARAKEEEPPKEEPEKPDRKESLSMEPIKEDVRAELSEMNVVCEQSEQSSDRTSELSYPTVRELDPIESRDNSRDLSTPSRALSRAEEVTSRESVT